MMMINMCMCMHMLAEVEHAIAEFILVVVQTDANTKSKYTYMNRRANWAKYPASYLQWYRYFICLN